MTRLVVLANCLFSFALWARAICCKTERNVKSALMDGLEDREQKGERGFGYGSLLRDL